MRKPVIVIGGAIFALVVLILFGNFIWNSIHESSKAYDAEVFIEISPGTSAQEIGRQLVTQGVIKDEFIYRTALWWSGRSHALQAGEYQFSKPLSAVAVIERLARGDVYTRPITFPEGLTIADMSAIYESHGFGSAQNFIEATRDISAISKLDQQAMNLEGYLFPETYMLPNDTQASVLAMMMVSRFKVVYEEELTRLTPEEQELSIRELVTLAGLIEKETAHDDERQLVASVYINRLRIGMPMQADPTLIYALQQAGQYDGNIRKGDFSFDSPYNTYKYPGLPPGPIASPGRASIAAALNPADMPYLYFVSRNDGTHAFSRTLAEHNLNVRRYQRPYSRKQ